MTTAAPPDDATRPTVEGASAPAPVRADRLRVGDRLQRYVVLGTLGRGGMGVVYRAYDPSLDRQVALKLVGRGGDDTIGRQRLAREAQALGKLSHPHVVAVHDVGTEGDEVFVTMELLEGAHLGEWLRARPRSWREIVDAFVQAGRGLAAAHAAGLVHRDVKPSNIHVDQRGHVRILDFGLARAQEPEPGAEPPPRREPPTPEPGAASVPGTVTSSPLTEPGFAAGTHRYMAPEQHAGVASPASDQYAFCASLFEALAGRLPWPNDSGTVHGPGSRALYAWLRTGLRADPAERHASMDVLVDGLERLLRRRRLVVTGLTVALALAAAAVLAVTVVGGPRQRGTTSPCATTSDELASVWSADRARTLRARLDAVAPVYDANAGGRLVDKLDGFATAWSSARIEACEATNVRHVQDQALLARRVACLDRRLGTFRSFVEALDEMDAADALDRGPSAAPDVSELGPCADRPSLLAAEELPTDPERREGAVRLQRRLDRAGALGVIGKYDEGSALADEVVAAAATAGLRELRAEALFTRARLEQQAGHGAAADVTLDLALDEAAGAGHVRLAARIMAFQIYIVGDLMGRTEEGIGIARAARAMARLAGDPPNVIAAIHSNVGNLYWFRGQHQEAFEHYAAALEIEQQLFGADHPDVAWSWNNMAMVREARGDFAGARADYQRAIAITQKALGRDHPEVAGFLNNLAGTELLDGKPEAARATATRGLALVEKALGPDHYRVAELRQTLGEIDLAEGKPGEARTSCLDVRRIYEAMGEPEHQGVAPALRCLGSAALALGDARAAVPDLERALAMMEASEADPLERARVKAVLARALWATRARPRARQLAEEAARALEGQPGHVRLLAEVKAWLDQHPPPTP